jgi:hypothetical protein
MKKSWNVCDVPGAWYGNTPDKGSDWGNVMVDAKRIAPALEHLRRRGFWIVQTEGKADFPNRESIGVLVQFRRRAAVA